MYPRKEIGIAVSRALSNLAFSPVRLDYAAVVRYSGRKRSSLVFLDRDQGLDRIVGIVTPLLLLEVVVDDRTVL